MRFADGLRAVAVFEGLKGALVLVVGCRKGVVEHGPKRLIGTRVGA